MGLGNVMGLADQARWASARATSAVRAPAGSEEGGTVVSDHERLVDPALGQAEARQRTSRTVPGACKEAAVLDPPAGTQDLAARALDDVVPGIIAEQGILAVRINSPTRHRLGVARSLTDAEMGPPFAHPKKQRQLL